MTFRLCKITAILLSAVVLIFACAVIASAENAGNKILGDANCDGEVTVSDVTCIQRVLVDLPVSDYYEPAADADGSGTVDISDAEVIQKWLAEMEVSYPIGEQLQVQVETTAAQPTEMPTDPDGWGQTIFRP